MNRKLKVIYLIVIVLLFHSCAYLGSVTKQTLYAGVHKYNPSQENLKHMLDNETILIYGKTIDENSLFSQYNTAVAAFSDKYFQNELVDIMHYSGLDTHYGLYLPEGKYTLLVFADRNHNKIYEKNEIIGRKKIDLTKDEYGETFVGPVDIVIKSDLVVDMQVNIELPEPKIIQDSLFYPKGTIRDIDDPLFDRKVSNIGVYHPTEFMKKTHNIFFYALEEELSHKIPVIFVHGMGGNVREFKSIIADLDRDRFKPWFFYYPSGSSLDQMSEVFYELFLSGKVISVADVPIVIVAHSMGGLVVRESLNKYKQTNIENQVELFITVATPFGGSASAAKGEEMSSLVLPSWRDLNPDGAFITNLYRKPLPESVTHKLVFAFNNPSFLKLGKNSDGVIDLSSQLYPPAQEQSHNLYGVNSEHAAILKNDYALQYILESIHDIRSSYPEPYFSLMVKGGYDYYLDNSYSELEKYYIRNIGKLLRALHTGEVPSTGYDFEHFIKAISGEVEPVSEIETAWLKFVKDYPEILE